MASKPSAGRSLRRSWALLRARPVVQLSLGFAIAVSLFAVCCGLGIFTAPWFLCELAAVQLAEAQQKAAERTRSWLAAGAVLVGAVLLISSVAWLSLLSMSTDSALSMGTHSVGAPVAGEAVSLRALSGGGIVAGAAALVALLFVLPFLYTALMLIERGGSLGGAVLESAHLVASGGLLPHLRLTLSAHLVQVAPLLVSGLSLVDPLGASASAERALISLPLLAASIPLGQGMIASAYVERHDEVAEAARTRLPGRPPRALVWLWTALVLVPLLSFGALGASLVRPSKLLAGQLPDEAELLGSRELADGELRLRPPGTALTISASRAGVKVVASDGGGAGTLPLPAGVRPRRARFGRVRDAYGIELTVRDRSYLTWIDAAGVRLDDGLAARLADRLPSWALIAMFAGLLLTASALLPVLSGLSRVRRAYARPAGERPPAQELSAWRRRMVRRATWAAFPLLPPAALALYWGFRALTGL